MDLLIAWLLFPVVALGVCTGVGLLVSRAAGGRVPGPLVVGVGLCGVVVASQVTTAASWSARLTVPLVLLLAVAGAVAGWRRPWRYRHGAWAAAAGLATFAMAGAPVVLSGEATFAGYTVLADTSIHLIGAEALLEHGRDFSSEPPSSYRSAAASYYNGSAYPAGGPTALGTLARIATEDPLWVFPPFLAFLLALLALALYELAGTVLRAGPARAAIAVVGAQPAIVTTYALQGSIKEIGAVSLVGLLAALVPWYVARRADGDGPRAVVALAVVTAAACAVVGAVALVWCAPLVAAALVAGARRAPTRGRTDVWVSGVAAALLVAVLSVQTLSGLRTYLDVTNSGRTPEARTGNLKAPLEPAQALGVWLRGDHRDLPDGPRRPATLVLQGLVGLAALGGAVLLARRRRWAPVLFLAVMTGATVVLVWQGTPWSDAKAYMIASPAIVFTALLGGAVLGADAGLPRMRRIAAGGVAGVIGAAVLASNALAYREVSLAPRDRFGELMAIADRYAGQGPALTPEYEEFAKYVLRDLAPESPVEGWRSVPLQLADPQDPPNLLGTSVEHGQLADAYVRRFPLLVLRRGFSESRPPFGYERVFRGRWYDVWRRRAGAEAAVLDALPLGTGRQAAAVPRCADVRELAARARRAGGALAYVARGPAPVFAPGAVRHAWNWVTDTGDPDVVMLFGPGRSRGVVQAATGVYDVWMEARVGRTADVLVDGRVVGRVRQRINPRRSPERVARVRLAGGRHTVEVRVGGGGLAPGEAGINRIIGPIGFVAGDPAGLPVRTMAPARWRTLCGRSLDWVAAVSDRAVSLDL